MALADIGNEIGKCIRIRQVLELIINGGAAASIDGIIQLKSEADAVFDADATAIRMHPTVIGFLNKWQNTMNELLAECDQMTYAVWRNRVPVDVNGTALGNDITGMVGDFDNFLRDNSKVVQKTTPAIGSATAGSTNTGSGTVIGDVLDTFNLNNQALQDGADFDVACTSDAITGGATQHQESFIVQSSYPHKIPNLQACMVPAADGSGDTGGGNRLQNEDATTPTGNSNSDETIPFENFTSDTPDGWTVNTGTPGTDVEEESTAANVYFGTYSLKLTGDVGGTILKISQDGNDFFNATSTDQKLDPLAHYLIGFYLKTDDTTGKIELYMDGTGYTAGATEKATYDMGATGALAAFTLVEAVVKMPKSIPSDMSVILTTTTAMGNTKVAYCDGLFVAKMYHSEAMGLNIHVVPGSTAFVHDERDPDRFNLASTNNWDGLFQEWFSRRTDSRDITQLKYNDVATHVNSDAAASAELAESKAQ